MVERIGERIGNYYLKELLGSGGFAETYLGEHHYLKTLAAIKVLQTKLGKAELEAFYNEARMIGSLKHPNIVRVLEFGVEGNTPYLVMEYASNGTLRQYHPRGNLLPLSTLILYVKQIAAALQYAHEQKLIHRDVKPENILLGEQNRILLGDFGIAVIAQTCGHSLQNIAGTVTYMAPEQIQGKPRPASDQYALGIIVYEWLCGTPPFSGTYTEVALQHECTAPPPLHEQITIAPEIEDVVLTALAKDPQQRFATIQAFADALELACSTHLLYNFDEKDIQKFEESPTDPHVSTPKLTVARPTSPLDSPSISATGKLSVIEADIDVQFEHPLPITPASSPREQLDSYGPEGQLLTSDEVPILEDQPISSAPSGKLQALQLEPADPVTPLSSALEQQAHEPLHSVSPDPAHEVAPFESSDQSEMWVKVVGSVKKRNFTVNRFVLLSLLVLLLIGGSSFIFYIIRHPTDQNQPRREVRASSLPEDPTEIAATQTAMKNIYREVTSDPVTITDPLTTPDNFGWNNAQYTNGSNKKIGSCSFENGSYHDRSTVGYFINCMATATNFSNFAYQATMTMVMGHSGGLVIRSDNNDSGYYFRISTDGTYIFQKVVGDSNGDTIQKPLASGNSTAIKTGPKQSNVITIISQGNAFYFFVNKQYVDMANDNSYVSGQIGVYTDSDTDNVEAIFSNVQVWKF